MGVENLPETKKVVLVPPETFSFLTKLKRAAVDYLRFVWNSENKRSSRVTGGLATNELNASKKTLLK